MKNSLRKKKKPTVKKLKAWLVNNTTDFTQNELIVIDGIDEEFTANMASYCTFRGIFGDEVDNLLNVAEDVIKWHTLFTDKDMVEKCIRKKYSDNKTVMDKLSVLKGLTFKDFGKLSYEFLCGISACDCDMSDGEIPVTIMDLMYNTNDNLNQIIFDKKYKFSNTIKARNGEESSQVKYEDLDELYLSPAVKRGVWRALVMTDEYVKAIGRNPDKIFVEVTRSDREKKEKKQSRLKNLQKLYKDCVNEKLVDDMDRLIKELNDKQESQLKQERLYLYFMQLGRCMYSGQPIDLCDLSTDMYDVDHIIPQSVKCDDSVHNNKVLVLRSYNKIKSDNYPISNEWQRNNVKYWELLRKNKLITDEKFSRLIRKEELTEEELVGFVNRQLTFTGQSATALAKLLSRKYPDTQIIYSKASLVSDFRKENKILKNRDVNDLHHAKDAYLNIVVGNVFHTRFSGNPSEYLYRKENGEIRKYNFEKIYNYDVKGAWNRNITREHVKNVYNKNSVQVSEMPITGKGAFYKQTLFPKGEGTMQLKAKGPLADINKYGGYKSCSVAYFIVVDSFDKKNKPIRTIEAMSIFYDYQIRNGRMTVDEYLSTVLKLTKPCIVYPKLKIKALLKVDGVYVYLAGITGQRLLLHNANQWYVTQEQSDYLRLISQYLSVPSKCLVNETGDEIVVASSRDGRRKDIITREKNIEMYDAMICQLRKPIYSGLSSIRNYINNIINNKDKFIQNNIEAQSKTLMEIVKFLECKGLLSDLSYIELQKNCGKILIAQKISDKDITVINMSPAGLYCNTVILNKRGI